MVNVPLCTNHVSAIQIWRTGQDAFLAPFQRICLPCTKQYISYESPSNGPCVNLPSPPEWSLIGGLRSRFRPRSHPIWTQTCNCLQGSRCPWNSQTNCMHCKSSHVILLRQRNLCIPKLKSVNEIDTHTGRRWQLEKSEKYFHMACFKKGKSSEDCAFHQEWTDSCMFAPPTGSSKPICLISDSKTVEVKHCEVPLLKDRASLSKHVHSNLTCGNFIF